MSSNTTGLCQDYVRKYHVSCLNYALLVQEKAERVHIAESEADHLHLVELLKDYVGLVGAVKDVLAERAKAFQNWRHAQGMVAKKKEQRARLEMSGRADKVFNEL